MKQRRYHLKECITDEYEIGDEVLAELFRRAEYASHEDAEVAIDVWTGGAGYVVQVSVDGDQYFWSRPTLILAIMEAFRGMAEEAPL